MQPITRFACVTALIACTTGVMANTADNGAQEQWHQAIQTGYSSLAAQTGQLATAAADYCESPGPERRERLNNAWLDAFLAWQEVRFVNFGPVENNNLSWQFQFWPDPKNLIARKANYLFSLDAPVDKAMIEQSGVAVQGFPMVEFLLFDEQLNTGANALPGGKSCAVLTEVTQHINRNSEDLANNWANFKNHYLTTEQYRDANIKAGMTALEILEERRLAQPMGLRGNGKRNPYISDAWRSGKSLMTVEATVTGLKEYYLPGLSLLLESAGKPDLSERISKQFDRVADNFPEANVPMATLLANDDRFRILQGLYVDVSQLATLINNEAAVALGIVRGFNSSDGD
ncbi:imelysin family protein [Marinobacter sp.]|uniref:imelysin family protein n=1 Tax=Marinobacter sp. TaxID=50741 RepID=UPI00356702DC